MSKTLTKEQIENWRTEPLDALHMIGQAAFRELCDMALSSLRPVSEELDPSLAHDWKHGKIVELENAYHKAYSDFAGPPQFRHSVNHDTYHRAGLIGVWNTALRESAAPQGEPHAWLYSARKPGKAIQWASIDSNDTSAWPVDQWTLEYTVRPLYLAPARPAVEWPETISDAVVIAAMKAQGTYCEACEPEREDGVIIQDGISQEDADRINAEQMEGYRDALKAARAAHIAERGERS